MSVILYGSDYLTNYYKSNPELIDFLDTEDSKKLIALAKNGDQYSRDRLIGSTMCYIFKSATELCSQEVEREDLIQIGVIGCIKAIDKYDINFNTKFITYAAIAIRNQMLQHIRNLKLNKYGNILSLDFEFEDESNVPLSLKSIIANPVDSESMIVENILVDSILGEIKKLPIELQDLIEFNFGLNAKDRKTQQELAKMYGVTQASISRKISKILKNISITLDIGGNNFA